MRWQPSSHCARAALDQHAHQVVAAVESQVAFAAVEPIAAFDAEEAAVLVRRCFGDEGRPEPDVGGLDQRRFRQDQCKTKIGACAQQSPAQPWKWQRIVGIRTAPLRRSSQRAAFRLQHELVLSAGEPTVSGRGVQNCNIFAPGRCEIALHLAPL